MSVVTLSDECPPALVAPLWAGDTKASKIDAAALQRLPLSFVENRGQADRRVAYYVQGSGASVYIAAASSSSLSLLPVPLC
jgi:hypothetical protein